MADEDEPEGKIFVGEPLGPCPSCKALIAVSLTPHQTDPNKRMVDSLIHPMPYCSYYADNEAEKILDDMLAQLDLAEAKRKPN